MVGSGRCLGLEIYQGTRSLFFSDLDVPKVDIYIPIFL